MQNCKNCGIENSDNSVFCVECGEKLKNSYNQEVSKDYVKCEFCGTVNPMSSMHCIKCSKTLPKSKIPAKSNNLCKNCGASNPPTSMFCKECGYKLEKNTSYSSISTSPQREEDMSYYSKGQTQTSKSKLKTVGILVYIVTVVVCYYCLDTYFQERRNFTRADNWVTYNSHIDTSDVLDIKEEAELYRTLFFTVAVAGLNLGTTLICTGAIKDKIDNGRYK